MQWKRLSFKENQIIELWLRFCHLHPSLKKIQVQNTSRNIRLILNLVIEVRNHLSTSSPSCWFGQCIHDDDGFASLHEWTLFSPTLFHIAVRNGSNLALSNLQLSVGRFPLHLEESSSSSCCQSLCDKDCFHFLTAVLHLALCCESDVHESVFMSLSLRFLLMVSLNRR